MKIEFEAEYEHGDIVNLRVEKSIAYVVTGYVLHDSHLTYELSNSEGLIYKHGIEIEKYHVKRCFGLK